VQVHDKMLTNPFLWSKDEELLSDFIKNEVLPIFVFYSERMVREIQFVHGHKDK